ncbi:MAG: hypothetical protein GY798_21580 [Hyphomicrobiales bacterium]|nr:hypothetical protein [Hyphomicrobiales bacterium]
MLARLSGDWIGRGTFKSSPSAEPELVYCKITNSLSGGGAVIRQKGRCAVATNSGRVTGEIKSDGAGGYSGSLESISTRGPATITGRASGDQITFQAEFIDRRTKKPGKATIRMVVGDGRYRLVSNGFNAKNNSDFVASDITFERR